MNDDSLNDIDDEDLDLNNIIILSDENGEDVQFEFLDLIEYDSEEYVVLLPVVEEGEENDDGEVVILKVEDSGNEEEESYVSVDDEETQNKVFEMFKEKFKDEFNFVDGE